MQTQWGTSLQNCECQNDNMRILTRDVSNRSGSLFQGPPHTVRAYPRCWSRQRWI